MCSEIFVSGQDYARDYYENIGTLGSFSPLRWAMRQDVDRDKREVRTRVFGAFETRSVFRDGLGCMNVNGEGPVDAPGPTEIAEPHLPAPQLPEIAGPQIVEPATPELKAVLQGQFEDPAGGPARWTHGVVIVWKGRVVAERYAPGWTMESQMHGWSASKSILNALIGILVRQGKVSVDGPAPLPAWQSPGDSRHAISIDNLLHMKSGLDLGESLTAGLSAAWNTASRSMLNERDPAAFAASADLEVPPGTRWNYANGNSVTLARIVRDQAGGHGADILRFAQRELFAPLGMRHVTVEIDATGTPSGGAFIFASVRDWARFGVLYLNDGVAGGRRILPEGWVKYTATPTPRAWVGYGAHWWTETDDAIASKARKAAGMPRDAFMASGIFGQYVVVVPSEQLVVARFGVTHDLRFSNSDIASFVAQTIAALHAAPPAAMAH